MQTMADLGVTGILEMPPAGTLVGIAKRQLKGVETFALKTPDQLDDARAFADKHGDASPIDSTPTWRMLVSPVQGHLPPAADIPAGPRPDARRVVGEVENLRGRPPSWPRTAARSSSGSSRTATLSPPASRWSACTPKASDMTASTIATAHAAPQHAAHPRASAAIGRAGSSPTTRSATHIDSSDEWIRTRSGIIERRCAEPHETVQMMSVASSRKALRAGRHRPGADRLRDRRDGVPPDADAGRRHRWSPKSSALRRRRRSTSRQPAPASATASAWRSDMIRSGSAKYVLAIGVERLSDITDPTDRGTAFIFADGAGAAVIGPSDDRGHRPGRLGRRRFEVRPDPAERDLDRRGRHGAGRRCRRCGWTATRCSAGRRSRWPRSPARRSTAPV